MSASSPQRPAVGLVLGVDVGNSKTHVAVTDAAGALLWLAESDGASPQRIGTDGCLRVITGALRGVGAPIAGYSSAALACAGLDLDDEDAAMLAATQAAGIVAAGGLLRVCNDTFAVLRAGTDGPHGVAVVCGAGINCVGMDGERVARFHSLGAISGDWGGGYDLGESAIGAACRSEDGRGPVTVLAETVPAYFGLTRPAQVVEAVHHQEIAPYRFPELAPLVLTGAETGDAVCLALVLRMAVEVVAFARAAAARLGRRAGELPVLLGGGLARAEPRRLLAQVRELLAASGERVDVRLTDGVPVVGALLMAHDLLAAHEGSLDAAGASRAVDAAALAREVDAWLEHLPHTRGAQVEMTSAS